MISTSFGPFEGVGAPDWTMRLNKASIRVNKEFSMSLSPVIRKFVNTNQFNMTNSEFIDQNNLQIQLNTSNANMSSTNIYKDGETPLYILDLHYDQTHPDIIFRLFNGKEVIFTRENQDFLMYLAQTLKISGLKRSLTNFIKFGESQTLKDLKKLGRLISEFNEKTFDDVYNFLLKYLQSDDENAIKQPYFVAFIIFNGCVARPAQMELFIKLAEKLNVLKEFAIVCIYNYKNKENLQESLFLIRHLLSRAEEEEEINRKKNNYLSVANSISDEKKSLIFSDISFSNKQKNVDPKDNNGFNNDSSDNDESENKNEEEKISMLQIFAKNFTPHELSSFKLHKEYAEAGINNDPIAIAVRNDDVSIFTDESKVNRRIINFSNYCVKPSLYERSTVINNSDEDVDGNTNGIFKRGIKYTGVPLICYAAYFGSYECFKYLVDEANTEIPSNLTRYAVCGGHPEIITFCQKRMCPREGEENANEQINTILFSDYINQSTQDPEEKVEDHLENANEKENEDENGNENEIRVQEEEGDNEIDTEQSSEESNVCVFDSRCLELAAIFHRYEVFKFFVDVLQIPVTDSVADAALKHFSFEVFVHIISKPGNDLNSLFLRSTKYSNEEAASLMSEFCDSYSVQEEDTLRTPLHYACEFGLSKVVKILIEKLKPNLKLKVNFEEDEALSQENFEEEEEEANVVTRNAELQVEGEEEENQIAEEEEEVNDVKTREVRFQLDQQEQREFDEEVQKGILEQTSSENFIHRLPNEEEGQEEQQQHEEDQQQEIPENDNQGEEEELNTVERKINLEPEQELDEQQQQEFEPEPESTEQQQHQEFEPEPESTEQQQQQEFEPEPEQHYEEIPEEQIEHQLEQIEQQQLEIIEPELENQPGHEEDEQAQQEEPVPEENNENQPEQDQQPDQNENNAPQNDDEFPNVQARDVQLELEIEEEEGQEQQQQQQQEEEEQQQEPLQNEEEDRNPINKLEIEEEEEEATEIMINDLADNNDSQPHPETETTTANGETNKDENESTEPIIDANTTDNIDNPDFVIKNSEEEENLHFKNNSLIEGNNELDELESPEVQERDVELNENENENQLIEEEEDNQENQPEQEEQPLITFSPSTTSDEDEFINNISQFQTANTSNLNLNSQRNIYPNMNLSSNVLSRSVILPQNSIDLNARDADNVTPLQLACKEGWINIVRMFAQLEYDEIEYDAISDYEKTALQFAEEASHKRIVDLLLKIKEDQSEVSENNDQIELAEE